MKTSDPAALAREAAAASARALRLRRWTDARETAALSERYTRLADLQRSVVPDGPIDVAEEDELRQSLMARLDDLAAELEEERTRLCGLDGDGI